MTDRCPALRFDRQLTTREAGLDAQQPAARRAQAAYAPRRPQFEEAAGGRYEQYSVRGEVVDRLLLAARRYARHRADRRWNGQQDLGAHFVVFFYREPGGAIDPLDPLRVATRIDQADEHVADLYFMLTQLHALASEYASIGSFDPRAHLANRVETMSRKARYVGLGVVTLDPGDISAEPEPLNISLPYTDTRPFRGIAVLDDGTRLIIRWSGGVAIPHTLSNRTMDVGPWPTRMWTWRHAETWDKDESEVARIERAVAALHGLIYENQTVAASNA